jgi:gluconolactonase
MRPLVLALLLLGPAGCGDDDDDDLGPPDAGRDAAPGDDAGTGSDAGSDASTATDAGSDAEVGVDAGPPPDPLVGLGEVELVDEGHQFLEGPQWRADEGVLVFSDIDADTIWELEPPSTIRVFRTPSGHSNGLAVDTDGLLLAAEHENRRVSRTLADGSIEAVADSFEGARLNSPNDIVVRSDGTIYFTDPPFGVNWDLRELDFHGVFRVAPDGTLDVVWRGDLESGPNGIALSPDERLLYFDDAMRATVHVLDVHLDGSADGERTFVQTADVPDGMAVDDWGNLWIATSAGVEVYAPDGARWGVVALDRQPANCAFGDDDRMTLYVTAEDALFRVRTAVRGLY